MLLTHNGDRLAGPVDKLASPVRTEVCSPESSHERDEATRFVGLGSARGRSDVLDTRHPEGWVAINLTETPDTDPCTQAPVNWRNADSTSK